MKKIIMLAIVLTTITVSAFANNITGVNQKVLNSFKKSFQTAEVVRWEMKDNLYKVTFKNFDKELFAYYNADGEQVAVTRNIHISQLPLSLASELQNKFSQGWLTELFELSSNGETAYYATIECSKYVIIYKADAASGWATFKKEKRK
jgi:hypothetical protein